MSSRLSSELSVRSLVSLDMALSAYYDRLPKVSRGKCIAGSVAVGEHQHRLVAVQRRE